MHFTRSDAIQTSEAFFGKRKRNAEKICITKRNFLSILIKKLQHSGHFYSTERFTGVFCKAG